MDHNIFQKKNGKCYPENIGENEFINSKLVIDPFMNLDHNQQQTPRINTKSLLKWINRNLKKRNQYLDYERILTMLSNCESAVEKSQQMLIMNQYEMNNYLKLYQKIESGVIEAESKLLLCKQNLRKSDEQLNSANRLETLSNLTKLETEIGNLNAIKDDLCFKLAKRQKQCHNLLNTAQNLQTMFAKEEHQIANAIENHLKTKQRQLLKQQLLAQGFMKNEFNNVLAMDSIVSIDSNQQSTNLSNFSATNTSLLPILNQTQPIATTTSNINPSSSIFKRSSSISTSILPKSNSNDLINETFANIKMPKIFLKDVSGKFIRSGKESTNKINIKLNKLHFINSPLQLSNRIRSPITTNYKVFDMAESSAIISCR